MVIAKWTLMVASMESSPLTDSGMNARLTGISTISGNVPMFKFALKACASDARSISFMLLIQPGNQAKATVMHTPNWVAATYDREDRNVHAAPDVALRLSDGCACYL